jgi:hypothetical protein
MEVEMPAKVIKRRRREGQIREKARTPKNKTGGRIMG